MTADMPAAAEPLDAAEAANLASTRARRAMIDSQLRTSGVNAPFVLKAMGRVARENHVPAKARATAYIDRAVRLENGNWIAAPLFYGMLLQEAAPKASDTAIVVDAGSGYLPELVRPLVAEVTVLSVAEAIGKGTRGTGANLLLIDGAVEQVPSSLTRRLADDARVVSGIIDKGVTRLATGRKSDRGIAFFPVHDLGIPQLGEFAAPKGWSF